MKKERKRERERERERQGGKESDMCVLCYHNCQ
jgi:hypothetical protein